MPSQIPITLVAGYSFNESGETLTLAKLNKIMSLGYGLLTGPIVVADGGTGSTTAADARTALSAAKLGANSDITSLAGLTTALSTAQGGTGLATVGAEGALFAIVSGVPAWKAVGAEDTFLTVVSGVPEWASLPQTTRFLQAWLDYTSGEVALGTLPVNSRISKISMQITETFNDSGYDRLEVGYAANHDAFAENTSLKALTQFNTCGALVHAEMYGVSGSAQNTDGTIGVYTKIDQFTTAGDVEGPVTVSPTNDQMTVNVSGTFMCDLQLSFQGAISAIYTFAVYKNGTALPGLTMQRFITSAAEVGACSVSGLLHGIEAGDVIDVRVAANGVTKNCKLTTANLSIVQVIAITNGAEFGFTDTSRAVVLYYDGENNDASAGKVLVTLEYMAVDPEPA